MYKVVSLCLQYLSLSLSLPLTRTHAHTDPTDFHASLVCLIKWLCQTAKTACPPFMSWAQLLSGCGCSYMVIWRLFTAPNTPIIISHRNNHDRSIQAGILKYFFRNSPLRLHSARKMKPRWACNRKMGKRKMWRRREITHDPKHTTSSV